MSGKTDAQGRYRVGVLGTGDYAVSFEDCNANPVYLSETFDGVRNGTPTAVRVTGGQDSTGIDADLDRGAIVRGTLRATTGDRIAGACAVAYDSTGRVVDTDRSTSSGSYELTRLDAGNHRIGFEGCIADGYLTEFYDDVATLNAATVLPLTRGQVRTGIDAVLVHCSQVDADADGLNLCDELATGSDPADPDSDGDGLADGEEFHEHGTSPVSSDSDNDRLTDGEEILVYGTDPLRVDTDGDQFSDGAEVHGGTCPGGIQVPGGSDPTNALSTPLAPVPVPGPAVKLPNAPVVLCR